MSCGWSLSASVHALVLHSGREAAAGGERGEAISDWHGLGGELECQLHPPELVLLDFADGIGANLCGRQEATFAACK